MKKHSKIAIVALLVAAMMILAVGCVAFKDAPQGMSEDTREFKKIKDERMDAEASDYKGYIYKKDNEAFCFRLKSPKIIEESKSYPLIVFLHGSGDYGSDNSAHMYKSLINNVAQYVEVEVFVFMPQGIKNYSWERHNKNTKGMDELYNLALDEIIKTFAVDTDRVYLTGMSMGGYGTFFQAYTHPDKYAAIAPMCGYYPRSMFGDLQVIKEKPIWLGHSRTDDVVEFSESEGLYNRLVEAGAKDVRTTWLDEYKHDMTEPFYDSAEFWQWLMSKKLS